MTGIPIGYPHTKIRYCFSFEGHYDFKYWPIDDQTNGLCQFIFQIGLLALR